MSPHQVESSPVTNEQGSNSSTTAATGVPNPEKEYAFEDLHTALSTSPEVAFDAACPGFKVNLASPNNDESKDEPGDEDKDEDEDEDESYSENSDDPDSPMEYGRYSRLYVISSLLFFGKYHSFSC